MNLLKRLTAAGSLALFLSMSPVMLTAVVLPGCGMTIFQSDPVGASLFTIKATYESSVRTAGRLYVQGLISEAQIRKFRDEANKFYKSYTAIVTLNEERKLTDGDPRLVNLQVAVTALEALVLSFSS
jgi:hypothetical protein